MSFHYLFFLLIYLFFFFKFLFFCLTSCTQNRSRLSTDRMKNKKLKTKGKLFFVSKRGASYEIIITTERNKKKIINENEFFSLSFSFHRVLLLAYSFCSNIFLSFVHTHTYAYRCSL